jgi:oxygen-dependent protoporphyrinogen oxidase
MSSCASGRHPFEVEGAPLALGDKAPQVAVVGAGIAGLSAAYLLRKSGFRVVVLEAAAHPGGRMSTVRHEGRLIDRGAQFLTSAYGVLLPLIDELGLSDELRSISTLAASVRDGKVRRYRNDTPHQLWTSGLLNVTSWWDLGWHSVYGVAPLIEGLDLSSFADWRRFDDEDAARWYTKHAGKDLLEYALEPGMAALFFQEPEGSSKAFAMWLLANVLSEAKLLTLERGLGSLTQKLADLLDVRLGEKVLKVERVAGKVEVTTADEVFKADYAVLATTASAAASLFPVPRTAAETALLSTPYSSVVKVALGLNPSYPGSEALKGVYGLAIPRKERKRICALSIESNMNRSPSDRGEMVELFVPVDVWEHGVDHPEDDLIPSLVAESERYLPGLGDHVEFTHVEHWREALPLSPVGRSSQVHAYRQETNGGRRILLAGDYVGTPTTEGAAETGTWVARQILRHARKTPKKQ